MFNEEQTEEHIVAFQAAPEHELELSLLYVSYANLIRKGPYRGPKNVPSLKKWCLELYRLQEDNNMHQETFVLYVQDTHRTSLSYELEDMEDVHEGSVVEIRQPYAEEQADRRLQDQIDLLEERVECLMEALVTNHALTDNILETMSVDSAIRGAPELGVVLADDRDDQVSISGRRRRSLGRTLSASSLVRLWSLRRRHYMDHLSDEVGRLRRYWKDLRYDTIQDLAAWEKALDQATSDIATFIGNVDARMSTTQRKRMEMSRELRAYLVEMGQLGRCLENVSVVINELTRDVVIRRIQPLEVVLAHAAVCVNEASGLGDIVKERFERVEALMREVWKEELMNVVGEEDVLKLETVRFRETQFTVQETFKTFAQLTRLISLRDQLPALRTQFGKENLELRAELHKELMTEVVEVASQGTDKQRVDGLAEMEKWRQVVSELKREQWDVAVFVRSLNEQRTKLRHVTEEMRKKHREDRMLEWHTPASSPLRRISSRPRSPTVGAASHMPRARSPTQSFSPHIRIPVFRTTSDLGNRFGARLSREDSRASIGHSPQRQRSPMAIQINPPPMVDVDPGTPPTAKTNLE